MFRGREVTHPERGIALLDRLADELSEIGGDRAVAASGRAQHDDDARAVEGGAGRRARQGWREAGPPVRSTTGRTRPRPTQLTGPTRRPRIAKARRAATAAADGDDAETATAAADGDAAATPAETSAAADATAAA